MEKISSRLTGFYRSAFLWIIFTGFVVSILSYYFFNLSHTFLILVFLITIPFLLIWHFRMKNLKTVYWEHDQLIVEGQVIDFKNILSVDKIMAGPNYIVRYTEGNDKKSFMFLPKFILPFFTPRFVKYFNQHKN